MIRGLQIRSIFWLAVATWAITLVVSGEKLEAALLKPAGVVLAVVTAAVALFERQLWRWRIFKGWLVSVPDIEGSYVGTLKSAWLDPATGQAQGEIKAFMSVYQTLSSISVRLYTDDSASASICAFVLTTPDDHWELVYTFRNEPKLMMQGKSRIHHGGARVQILGTTDTYELSGNYFNDRGTIGEMSFKRSSRTRCKSYAEGQALEPSPQ